MTPDVTAISGTSFASTGGACIIAGTQSYTPESKVGYYRIESRWPCCPSMGAGQSVGWPEIFGVAKRLSLPATLTRDGPSPVIMRCFPSIRKPRENLSQSAIASTNPTPYSGRVNAGPLPSDRRPRVNVSSACPGIRHPFSRTFWRICSSSASSPASRQSGA